MEISVENASSTLKNAYQNALEAENIDCKFSESEKFSSTSKYPWCWCDLLWIWVQHTLLSLFDDVDQIEKENRFQTAIDVVREQFGFLAIQKGTVLTEGSRIINDIFHIRLLEQNVLFNCIEDREAVYLHTIISSVLFSYLV